MGGSESNGRWTRRRIPFPDNRYTFGVIADSQASGDLQVSHYYDGLLYEFTPVEVREQTP